MYSQQADGVLGLGNSRRSLPAQVRRQPWGSRGCKGPGAGAPLAAVAS
jgi:hypothetical protein